MQTSLDYRSTRPEDVVELTRPVLRREHLEIEYEIVLNDDDEIIELVAPLDDDWFAEEGDDVDDGASWVA